MRVINRFSWHKHHGTFAEKYLRHQYFKGLGLRFRKISRNKAGKKPDGYILNGGKRIALAEIKLVKSQKRKPGIQRITLDETVRRAIRSSKSQLKSINTTLPRITYLIRDDVFFKPEVLREAIFGKWITQYRGEQVLFNGYKGFYPKYRQDDKFRDGIIAAIICYVPMLKGYRLWVYRNRRSKPIPVKLLDKKHIEEMWDYSSTGFRRVI